MSLPAPQPSSDADLVDACRRGERGSWERLVRRFERLVFTVPRRAGLGPDLAADVFQTVFMRLHEHLDGLEQPGRVHAWLVTTARRETLRILYEQRRTVPLVSGASDDDGSEGTLDALIDPDPLPDELLDDLQQRHHARTALASLAEPCRSLLGMLYGSDEPPAYTEIASRLGVAVGSIGPTRARCLAKLRELMDRRR